MNRTQERIQKQTNPAIKASLISRFTFWWMIDIFKIGNKRPIEEHELYELKDGLHSSKITDRFHILWEEEKRKKSPSLLRAMYNVYGLQLIYWGLSFCLFETVLRVLQPLCLGGLVSYFVPGQTSISLQQAYMYATGIVLASLAMVVSFHPFILWVLKIGGKYRLGCGGLIYKKTLKLSKASIEDGLNGKVINILSNDLAKFDIGLAFLHDVWKGPLEAFILGYFIYLEIGISGLIGMMFLTSFVPLQAWIGKKSAQLRLRTAKRTDFRVRIMNEIILGMQVIKMYAWEQSFATMVDKIRKKEVNAIRGIAYIRATITSFAMMSKIAVFLSLVSYVYFDNLITARKVFIVTSYFNMLNWSMVYFWPVAITHVAEAYVSVRRVQEYLLKSEVKPKTLGGLNNLKQMNIDNFNNGIIKSKTNGSAPADVNDSVCKVEQTIELRNAINLNDEPVGIDLINASAAWTTQESGKNCGIFNMNLKIGPSSLCAVVGQVGAGKSTLLNTLLGELELDEGSLKINGVLSYASQEAWLFEGSIRNNIIFVEDFDEERYNDVVRVCALEEDFKKFSNGDQTVVGERGISLSGGQRARVNLARAIYKNTDIYLLDDPLSAVDTHVGRHIFDRCIKQYLKNKICILVTHQLQYLQDIEHIIIMNNGYIEAQGSYPELRRNWKESFLSLSAVDEAGNGTETIITKIKKSTSFCEEENNEEILDRRENQASGKISFDIYKTFLRAVNSPCYVAIVLIMFIVADIAVSGADYFVSRWVNWEESNLNINAPNTTDTNLNDTIVNSSDEINSIVSERQMYMTTYAVIMAVGVTVYLYRSFAFFKLCLRVSINLHNQLFRGITRAKMLFYNTNPSGRILNRFARDINNVDSLLPIVLIDCIDFILNSSAIIIIVVIVNPWLLLPTAVITVLLYFIREMYVSSGRSLKRIEALSRSPIYSHVNATLQGLSTVRGFKAETIVEKEFHDCQDHNTSSWLLYVYATRCFAVWLDIICVIYIALVTYSFLFFSNGNKSGDVGLAILSSINLIGMCQWGMRQTAELENQMTSVERIVEYATVPSEPALKTETPGLPPNGWPKSGTIEVDNLNLRYTENASRVLRNLTFNVIDKEKIGVVGRTGAGKSSIIQALFRLANNEGQIKIDGVDTSLLGLHDLRQKMSIIPQDPVLFSGSLRFNLDPFDEKSDNEMWNALEQVELKEAVSALAGGLDCRMLDGGSNFSMGQRQLVCLARAILRNNKILILDEATANVDPETDKLIQNTIRKKFVDCTVITIAHRLHTVMDYDKVLVMDAGEIVEFDHPYELIQKPAGVFRKLIDQTGPATASILIQAAKENYENMKKQN